METLTVTTMQRCIDILDGIDCSIRRVDVATSEEATVVFRRDSENNWYIDEIAAQ